MPRPLERPCLGTHNQPGIEFPPPPRISPMRFPPLSAAVLACVAAAPAAWAVDVEAPTNVTWKKTVIDKRFVSEGVTIADVNKDGKMDILTGEFWYEAPDWKPHRIRQGQG